MQTATHHNPCLARVPVTWLKYYSGLISVNASDTLSAALKTLAQNGILSAPVYDAQKDQFIGSVDVLDLVTYVVEASGPIKSEDLDKELPRFFALPVTKVIDKSTTNPFVPVSTEATVGQVINLMEKGVHRLPLVDPQNKLVAILSQSDLVPFLLANKTAPELIKLMGRTLLDLELVPGGVVSVSCKATMRQCFTALAAYKVSGIAIVDSHTSKLVGTISASDLKGMTQENFVMLGEKARDWMARRGKLGFQHVLTCRAEDTLERVLELLNLAAVHRIFVVDENQKVVGIVPLTSIMQIVARALRPCNS
jgi:5'-AMP-activated protein kinase regulatory gamma subunit